jgi:predicted dehydrogenase
LIFRRGPTKTFGVGISGAGTIGAVHAEALEELEDARLVAVAAAHEATGRKLAETHGAEWHAGFGELLARPDVDVVILCTPSGLHPDEAVAAARAGKHVITEKPMAVTLEGADRMFRACAEAGVALSVVFQYRFNRDALRLKRAVEAGLLGDPVLGNAFVHWHRTQAYYEGEGRLARHVGARRWWCLDEPVHPRHRFAPVDTRTRGERLRLRRHPGARHRGRGHRQRCPALREQGFRRHPGHDLRA